MWRSIVLIAALALGSGCVSVVSIDAEDSTSFTHFEVSAPIGERDQLRVQLRASSSDGQFSQELDPGERIEIGDDSIIGPTKIAGKLDLTYYSIALGTDFPDSTPPLDNFRFGFYLGLALTEFDLELDDGTSVFDERDDTTEVYLQWALDYRISEKLTIGFAWAGSLGADLSGISEIDLELGWTLAGPLRIAGGYRWLEYNYAEQDDESHIEVDFRGPFIALELAFD